MRRLLLLAFLLGPFAAQSEAGGPGKIPTDSEEEFFEKLLEHLLNEKEPAPATVEVRLPAAAELFFDGAPTMQRGLVRRFVTPPLEPGWGYTYKVTARWQSPEGKAIDEARAIT